MKEHRTRTPPRFAAVAAAAALAAWAAAGPAPPSGCTLPLPVARAALPSGAPTFANPLVVDNAYFPVVPRTLKVFGGRDGRETVLTVETHPVETREFLWSGQTIPCRIVRESAFLNGRLLETSDNYFAQADDRSVYAFGEISSGILLEDAEPAPDGDEGGSWVVGAVGPEDPEDTVSIVDPTLFMPADPEAGDLWTSKDVPGVDEETVEALRIDASIRVPGGRFLSPLRVQVRSPLSPGAETKWYGQGSGEIRSRSKGEQHRLLASGLGNH